MSWTALRPADGKTFASAVATWTVKKRAIKSELKALDSKVKVRAQYSLTNYYTPTVEGNWNGQDRIKGVYANETYPAGLYDWTFKGGFLDALSPKSEGLGTWGGAVVRNHQQAKVADFERVTDTDGGK